MTTNHEMAKSARRLLAVHTLLVDKDKSERWSAIAGLIVMERHPHYQFEFVDIEHRYGKGIELNLNNDGHVD